MPRHTCSLQSDLRRVLHEDYPDGASDATLADLHCRDRSNVRAALAAMPDVYIDRWEPTEVIGHFRPIYLAVEVPANCPKPEVEATA